MNLKESDCTSETLLILKDLSLKVINFERHGLQLTEKLRPKSRTSLSQSERIWIEWLRIGSWLIRLTFE